ncbi:hypothetical protein DOM22_05245 [Bdellovibrio sp. ZAP7]|uniref:DUF2971 domain-containing protein n=1 Tax=Bdellovibrio sp. ZAP7 TaxID=2231053 RepID=UPI00115801D2|nr:DUF2971 domain-containing protein [Bdellovibrio sp. ZAP7]QDK44606.1 hypothetical protein DOM22_05245 [Bdellovibrio sp. ZAP7]
MDILPEAETLLNSFVMEGGMEGSVVSPSVLYHYTSCETFLNILKNQSLWLTHAYYTNDASEFSHGMNLFIGCLDGLIQFNFQQIFIDRMKEFMAKESKNPSLAPYIFCLTENKDQLSQWRGYGDFGSGVSIGLKTSDIEAHKSFHMSLLKIVYDDSEKRQIVGAIFQKFVNLVRNIGQNVNNISYVRRLALDFFRVAYTQSLRFKDKAWREESEWRCVILAESIDLRVKVRSRAGMLIPYVDESISSVHHFLDEVVVGPKASFDLQAASLEKIKIKLQSNFKISRSALPFR